MKDAITESFRSGKSSAHIGIGLGILLLCILWCILGVFMFFIVVLLADSRGRPSLFDPPFILLFVVFGSVFLGGLWCAFLSFRRAWQAQRLDMPAQTLTPPERH
jgi:uncharacterized membrane protein YedE/YeeE